MDCIAKTDTVDYQLSLTAPARVVFVEGGETVLTPARWTPVLDGDRVPLDGDWHVIRWPFPVEETALVGRTNGFTAWEHVRQPGKVFYYDPEQSADSIPGWDRVTLAHIDPQDGAVISREVTVPAAWRGKRILLRFEGIYPAGVLYWDGQQVGEQWSGLTPIEIDITALAVPGAHTVAVRLYRRHPAVQLDMPRHALEFVGLNRSAFLHAVEIVHISDIRLQPELAADYVTGALGGDLVLRNTAIQACTARLGLALTDPHGQEVAGAHYDVMLPAGGETTVTLAVPVGPVEPWSAERPRLYACALSLSCEGQPEQVLTRRIGFRRFELGGGRPRLNGHPVKFRGVNHLTFHPTEGMHTPIDWLRQSLTLMKRANVNAIRTHFFAPEELAALCDEMGLYLLQELPLDWGTHYLQDPALFGPMLHRMEACVRRDRNHPALMIWCIGNENMPETEAAYVAGITHLNQCEAMVKRLD
ncbi:MAG: hypothetical protein M1423_00195, partial [Acidobacteria bacterium]|nr:hypothetical protein [Acidobacteriota bacterium]